MGLNYIHIPKVINNAGGDGFMHDWHCEYSIIVWDFNACADKSECEVLEVAMATLTDTVLTLFSHQWNFKRNKESHRESNITQEPGAPNLPMTPKMPRMFGAKMTSKLMRVRRVTAMAMWRGHQKVLFAKNNCWIALLTWEKILNNKALKSDTEILPVIQSWLL